MKHTSSYAVSLLTTEAQRLGNMLGVRQQDQAEECREAAAELKRLRGRVEPRPGEAISLLWPMLPDDIREAWQEHTDQAGSAGEFYRDVVAPWLVTLGG